MTTTQGCGILKLSRRIAFFASRGQYASAFFVLLKETAREIDCKNWKQIRKSKPDKIRLKVVSGFLDPIFLVSSQGALCCTSWRSDQSLEE
jgi:hypothetical protein